MEVVEKGDANSMPSLTAVFAGARSQLLLYLLTFPLSHDLLVDQLTRLAALVSCNVII